MVNLLDDVACGELTRLLKAELRGTGHRGGGHYVDTSSVSLYGPFSVAVYHGHPDTLEIRVAGFTTYRVGRRKGKGRDDIDEHGRVRRHRGVRGEYEVNYCMSEGIE